MAPKTLAFFFGKAKTAEEKTQSDESMRGSTGNTTRENKPGEIAGEGSVCTPAKSGLETSSITRYCFRHSRLSSGKIVFFCGSMSLFLGGSCSCLYPKRSLCHAPGRRRQRKQSHPTAASDAI